MSPLAAFVDPKLTSAPCQLLWTDHLTYPPWMEMEGATGASYWRMVGTKVTKSADLSQPLVDEVEAVFPGYIREDAVWSEPSTGFTQYLKAHPRS